MTVALKCKDCGTTGDKHNEVLLDSGLCSECEENYEYCAVCDEWLHDDSESPCRHLFWAEWGEWLGAGSYEWRYCREGFERLLRALRSENVATMRAKLVAHDYGGCNADLLQPRDTAIDYARYTRGSSIWDVMRNLERRGRPSATLLHIGLGWVTTLEAGKTDDADDVTVQWIDEWPIKRRMQQIMRRLLLQHHLWVIEEMGFPPDIERRLIEWHKQLCKGAR